jgi:flagellar protein FlaI
MLDRFLSGLRFGSRVKKSIYPKIIFRRPRHLIIIPQFDDITKVKIKYPLIEPFANAEIKWLPEKRGLIYNLIEPPLSDKEKRLLKKIEESLTEIIDVKISHVTDEKKITEYLQRKTESILEDLGIKIPKEVYEKVMYYILRDFFGLNEIEAIMNDPYIEDIGCNGLDTPVYVVHKRYGSIVTNLLYTDPNRLSDFVVKLSERCGRYISYAVPLLDGSLPDGSRVQASLAKDVTTRGPTYSIRKFRINPYSPIDLIELGTVSSKMMAYLWVLVQYNTSIMICGGVSTGKTTLLNVLSMFIPPEDKIISIEDTREINLPHENWIPSVSRMGFGIPGASGKRYGEINLFDLLKESFRQNPDYVVVGEVRGKEAYVMFQGIASGHPSMGTIHAGSIEDVMKRLETPPIELSPSLIESLDLLIVLTNSKEKGKSARRVKEIVEIQSVDTRTGIAHTNESFSWIPSEDSFRETLLGSDLLRRLSFQEGVTYQTITKEINDRERVLDWMKKHELFQFDDVCKLVNLYYKDKKTIMEWVRKDISPRSSRKKSIAKKAWGPDEKKPKHPPIVHKPDIPSSASKPKMEIKKILSKVKTKPFKLPEEGSAKPEKHEKESPEKDTLPASFGPIITTPEPLDTEPKVHKSRTKKKTRTRSKKPSTRRSRKPKRRKHPVSPGKQLKELKELRKKIKRIHK